MSFSMVRSMMMLCGVGPSCVRATLLADAFDVVPENLLQKAKRQDRPPAVCDERNCGALFPFIDCFLEFVSRCEFCDTASGDLYGRSCLRVPAIASLALGDGECSESDQGYPVPFFEGRSYAVHGGIDRGRRLRLRNTAGSGDPINEICFVHALS